MNVIFPKKHLDKDPNYFKNNVMLRLIRTTPAARRSRRAESRLTSSGRPYLNGYKFFIQHRDVRTGRRDPVGPGLHRVPRPAHGPSGFRSGSIWVTRVEVQQNPLCIHFDVSMNNTVKPFNRHWRAEGPNSRSIDTRRQGPVRAPRVCGTSGRSPGRPPSGRWRRPSSRIPRLRAGTRRRTARRPSGSWRKRAHRNGFKLVLKKTANVKLPYQAGRST